MTNNLLYLMKELQDSMRGATQLNASITARGLELSLDIGSGFEGYERANASPLEKDYCVTYLGMFGTAFDTFLDQENSRMVERSPVLREFRSKVEQTRKEGRVEVYDEKTREFYSRLMSLEQIGVSQGEIDVALRVFCEIFLKKIERKSKAHH